MIHAKKTNNDRLDIAQNPNLPNLLLGTLSGLLKVDDGKRYLDILSDITRLVGMLARATYEKTTGV